METFPRDLSGPRPSVSILYSPPSDIYPTVSAKCERNAELAITSAGVTGPRRLYRDNLSRDFKYPPDPLGLRLRTSLRHLCATPAYGGLESSGIVGASSNTDMVVYHCRQHRLAGKKIKGIVRVPLPRSSQTSSGSHKIAPPTGLGHQIPSNHVPSYAPSLLDINEKLRENNR